MWVKCLWYQTCLNSEYHLHTNILFTRVFVKLNNNNEVKNMNQSIQNNMCHKPTHLIFSKEFHITKIFFIEQNTLPTFKVHEMLFFRKYTSFRSFMWRKAEKIAKNKGEIGKCLLNFQTNHAYFLQFSNSRHKLCCERRCEAENSLRYQFSLGTRSNISRNWSFIPVMVSFVSTPFKILLHTNLRLKSTILMKALQIDCRVDRIETIYSI